MGKRILPKVLKNYEVRKGEEERIRKELRKIVEDAKEAVTLAEATAKILGAENEIFSAYLISCYDFEKGKFPSYKDPSLVFDLSNFEMEKIIKFYKKVASVAYTAEEIELRNIERKRKPKRPHKPYKVLLFDNDEKLKRRLEQQEKVKKKWESHILEISRKYVKEIIDEFDRFIEKIIIFGSFIHEGKFLIYELDDVCLPVSDIDMYLRTSLDEKGRRKITEKSREFYKEYLLPINPWCATGTIPRGMIEKGIFLHGTPLD